MSFNKFFGLLGIQIVLGKHSQSVNMVISKDTLNN